MIDPDERVANAALHLAENTGRFPSPSDVAMALVEEDVERGEYEGCSTELEIAASGYLAIAERIS